MLLETAWGTVEIIATADSACPGHHESYFMRYKVSCSPNFVHYLQRHVLDLYLYPIKHLLEFKSFNRQDTR